MATPSKAAKAVSLRNRRLHDIRELMENPYPNIRLHPDQSNPDSNQACLILTPEGWAPIHLTVDFGQNYPLNAPRIRMDSMVVHPNVFDDYICASILNNPQDYTPAYTLKGIAIQLLSFFASDNLEQDYGNEGVDLAPYREYSKENHDDGDFLIYPCHQCGFGPQLVPDSHPSSAPSEDVQMTAPPAMDVDREHQVQEVVMTDTPAMDVDQGHRAQMPIGRLPNEMLLDIFDLLDFEDLINFGKAWARAKELIEKRDIIHVRELQCFVLKRNYKQEVLGVGVAHSGKELRSEFDLLSKKAYDHHHIRRSIQGNTGFRFWLPLPLSYKHWQRVNRDPNARESLTGIASALQLKDPVPMLYSFMSDIVVRLNDTDGWHRGNSTLRHASDKAIESYFHLFHLLLCLATEGENGKQAVRDANAKLRSFMQGRTSKEDCPSLGVLLVSLLISDIDPTEVRAKLVTEAITRNVLWLLDQKRGNKAELAYLETDDVSQYRITETFKGSLTSYRLFMFHELFRRTARPSSDTLGSTTATASPSDLQLALESSQAAPRTFPVENTEQRAGPHPRSWGNNPASAAPVQASATPTQAPATPTRAPAWTTRKDWDKQLNSVSIPSQPQSTPEPESQRAARTPVRPQSVTTTSTNPASSTPSSSKNNRSGPNPNTSKTAEAASAPELKKELTPLEKLRDELFDRHGAPPAGTATKLAAEVRRLQGIDNFADFFKEMGIPAPDDAALTALLRDTVKTSMDRGYSKTPTESEKRNLACLRLHRDKSLRRQDVEAHLKTTVPHIPSVRGYNFFPGRQKAQWGPGRR